jgi:hypothetical protein
MPLLVDVLKIVFAPIKWAYDLSGIERRGFYKRREQLLQELRSEAPFLFAEYGAILPDKEPREVFAFDGTILTVSFQTVSLELSRCRGDLHVMFTFEGRAGRFEFSEVLAELGREPVYGFSLGQLSTILRSIMPELLSYRNRSSSHGSPRM